MAIDFEKLINGVGTQVDDDGREKVLREDLPKFFENFYKLAKSGAIVAVTTEAISGKPGIVGLVVKDGKLAGSLNREGYFELGEFIADTAKTFSTVGLSDIKAGRESAPAPAPSPMPTIPLNTSNEIITWLQMKIAEGELAIDDVAELIENTPQSAAIVITPHVALGARYKGGKFHRMLTGADMQEVMRAINQDSEEVIEAGADNGSIN